MKKTMIFALIACMLLSFAACTPSDSDGAGATAPVFAEEDNFGFDFMNCRITLHAGAETLVAALGEPVNYTESTSCAFEGLDKSYYYGSIYLETYPLGGLDYVYGWWFADDTVTNDEGIYIGAPQADVEKAYGAATFNGTNAYVVKKPAGTLTVIISDGVVSSIQYAINMD